MAENKARTEVLPLPIITRARPIYLGSADMFWPISGPSRHIVSAIYRR